MGIQPSPVTSEYCENYPEKCFPPTEDTHLIQEENEDVSIVIQ